MATTLDRPLYLTLDNKIVEEGDRTARFVLGVAGSVINDEDAKLYGLEEYLKKGGPKAAEPAPNTTREQPGAGKAQYPAQNKGK